MDSREATNPAVHGAPGSQDDRSAIPLLETKRLRLRGHRLTDFAECVAMWSDPAVTRFIGGKPSSPQQTWTRLLSYLGHWAALRFGYWAIEERSTAAYVGEIGFADFKRDIVPAMSGYPEFGFALVSSAHGRGYATEAARAVVAWGDGNLAATRTVCLIDPDNAASIRIANTCGYEVFERATFNGKQALFLARNRPHPS